MAARTATASAGPMSSVTRPNDGIIGAPIDEGSAPMRDTSHPANPATSAAVITPNSDAGIERCNRGRPTMTAATMATRASDSAPGAPIQATTER